MIFSIQGRTPMITKDTVVSMSYRLKNPAGEELGQADSTNPLTFLQGAGQIVPGLEDALEGLTVGDKKDVTVTAKDGYGELNSELKIKVERKQFPADADIKPGMQFRANISGDHEHTFTVMDVQGEDIFIDGNHPLAGQTLHFSVEIIGVRPATPEELTHGHAHGPDGTHSH
jgi:FKBP-type peptidyl-prolyl cis-trans isomerase SlyD